MEFCRQHEKLATLVEQLLYVQMRIQEINSSIATPNNDDNVNKDFDSTGSFTKQLEEWIDEMHDNLPLLKNFILPVLEIAYTIRLILNLYGFLVWRIG